MSSLVASASLKDFFKTLLDEAMSRQRVEVAEVTEYYLVNLLSDFAATDRLFTEQEDGRKEQEPLAMLFHRAQLQSRDEKIRTLRRLGDVSLYTAGFFSDALREKVVGPDYYIQMGGAAYGQVAELSPATGFGAVYRELCVKFRALVEVLEQIAAEGQVAGGPQGALRVYESYVRTGSDKLERVLIDAGFIAPKGPLN